MKPTPLRAGVGAAILVFVAVLGLSCSNPPTPPFAQTQPVSTAAPTTITWSFWGDAWELAVNQRIIRAFERENPDIRVQIEHRPWNQYFDWLRNEWKSGRSPDLMFLNYIPSYVALGELEPLNNYINRDQIQLNDFYPALLESFSVDNNYYGLPRDNDTKVIYYNRTHFAEAGLMEPRDGWTWDDIRTAAQRLTRQEGSLPRYGLGFEPDYWWLVWAWQRGGGALDDPRRPNKVLLDAPETVSAIQFLQDLIYQDRVTPPVAQMNTEDMYKLFREGRLSMLFGNHALVPGLVESNGLAWDVAPLPRDVAAANVGGGAGFVMSKRSANKEAAWELMKFLTSPKGQAMLVESGVITPARRSIQDNSIFIRQQKYRADVFLSETERARSVPNFPGVTEMDALINQRLAAVWRGERTAAEVMTALAPDVRRLLGVQGQ